MKTRISLLLFLIVLPLALGGSVPALADDDDDVRSITGDIGWVVPQWGNVKIWFHFDVREADDDDHEAEGLCSWMLYNENNPEGQRWRYVDTRPTCVVFGKYQGKPAATFVTQIVNKIGFGQGEPGQYAVVWVLDGGTPGSAGDMWAKPSYQDPPPTWIEFWPADEPPDCEDFLPKDLPKDLIPPQPMTAEGGDLVIHE
jgi:hypothetical protein